LQILDISEFTYGEMAAGDDRGPLQTAERVDAIYNNMDLTGIWMRGRFISLANYLDTMEDRLLRQLLPSRASSRAKEGETSRRLQEQFLKSVNFTIVYGGGCDGNDQDGDNVTDNCEEDLYPPGLSFPASLDRKIICPVDLCLNEYFQTEDEARLFIKGVIDGTDDCAVFEYIKKDLVRRGECGETEFVVTPVQFFPESSSCSNVTLEGEPMTVMVGLDETGPIVTCGFSQDASKSVDGETLFIEEDSANFVDTAFYFDIEENCPGDVKVEVIVKTNEYTGKDNGNLVALSATQNVGSVEQAFLFVAPQSCRGNGGKQSDICKQDPATHIRFYEIQVTAVDRAGNKEVATCRVIVKPADNIFSSNVLVGAVASSTTRIPLSKLDLTWNNALAPSSMPSSAPSVSMQPSLSVGPSEEPSDEPSVAPSDEPSLVPSAVPSVRSGKKH
jgi:hypothetical protein